MAKLADALDLGSSSERSEGSSPFIRIFNSQKLRELIRYAGNELIHPQLQAWESVEREFAVVKTPLSAFFNFVSAQ